MKSLPPITFRKKALSGEYKIIDIRTSEELLRDSEIISEDQVLHLDFYDSFFKQQIAKLDKVQKYLIYCGSGIRSRKALKIFEEFEFNKVHDLDGGKQNWNEVMA